MKRPITANQVFRVWLNAEASEELMKLADSTETNPRVVAKKLLEAALAPQSAEKGARS
jgi:hypothetical protein